MKLSTTSRYGVRALVDIALNANGRLVLRDVAHRQGISVAYLEQIITPLVSAGIIRSARGVKGGVWLARDPRGITLREIMQILEGSIELVECAGDAELCDRSRECVTREIWAGLGQAMAEVLDSTTLEDLVERQRAKLVPSPEPPMYYI